MKQINICYMINHAYLNLTLESIQHIKKSFKSKNHTLKFYIIGIDDFDTPEGIEFIKSPYGNMPILHQRVYIPELLNVDRVIFIDSDTITLRCISKLWETDLQNNVIGACQHCECDTFGRLLHNWRTMQFSPYTDVDKKLPYFNCGVMLMDCKKWREQQLDIKCLQAIDLYKHTRYKGYDEPGFNLVLLDKWKMLNKKWNYLPSPDESYTRCYILHYYGEYPAGTPRHNMF